jgi:hypothetical protein
MSFDFVPFQIGPALLEWAKVCAGMLGIVLAISMFISLLYRGPAGIVAVFRHLAEGVIDTVRLSPRRVLAVAQLTYREAVRRKALLVFVIFGLLIMFAGWFMSNTTRRADLQVVVYISFVLRAVSWLILPVVLLLACWGLPADIKARSLHTVVTKPVRRNEIVLGRILGFIGVGTLVLGVMSAVGYVWILRYVPDSSLLVSRVPIFCEYDKFQAFDREGNPGGVNVGDIWEHREYIEGATQARATWVFDNVTPAVLNEDGNLHLESSFEAFRTHKGTIDRGLLCQFYFINKEKDLVVQPIRPFEVGEFRETVNAINPKIRYTDEQGQQREVDLFEDLVQNGKLQVDVQCVDPGQFLGVARPDLFIRPPDRPFYVGYTKAIIGIWLMTTLIIVLSVTASTIVKGPVATLLTLTFIVVGLGFRDTISKLLDVNVEGGGPFEAWYRLFMHMNPTTPIENPIVKQVVEIGDAGAINMVWLFQHIIPDFGVYFMSPWVANGFDVDWSSAMLPAIATTLGYLLPCLVIGYFCLKLRELESK